MQLFDLEPPFHLVAVVEGGGDLGDQLPVFGLGGEITAAALDQLLLQPVFPVPVRTLDRAVLVGNAAVVAVLQATTNDLIRLSTNKRAICTAYC